MAVFVSRQLCDCSPATDAEVHSWCCKWGLLSEWVMETASVHPRMLRRAATWRTTCAPLRLCYCMLKTWILKMYQWSSHVMWHSLLGSELSFDPVFIKRWGTQRNRLWLHVCVILIQPWHNVTCCADLTTWKL